MNPEVFCPSYAEWYGFEFIKTPQGVVRHGDILRFKSLYQSGIAIPPAECYIHPVSGELVIMDGNHRARAFYDLLQEGYFYDYFYGNNALPVNIKALRRSRRPDPLNSLLEIQGLQYI